MMQPKSVDELVQAANAGDTNAAYRLAELYRLGEGVEQNDAEESVWYMKDRSVGYVDDRYSAVVLMQHVEDVPEDPEAELATLKQMADNGDVAACCLLGFNLRIGRGCTEDYEQSLDYFGKAIAITGHADCMDDLLVMYRYGWWRIQDIAVAVAWCREVAEQGVASAQYNLGSLYRDGCGVKKDVAQAFEWYNKAAEQGYAIAQNSIGVMYANGTGVEKDEAIAVEWYRKAAKQGYSEAQNNLGDMYYRGIGVEKDDDLSFKWTRLAAEQGDVKAQFNLGLMYEKGEGVQKNEPLATEWYRKAAERGFAKSQYLLAYRYTNGTGVEKNDSMAVEWYRKAAEQGHAGSQYSLGVMYFYGTGIGKDDLIALEYFRKAASQGHAGAQYNLGVIYAYGTGAEKDAVQAAEWYRKAAEQGYSEAQYYLGNMCADGVGVTKDEAVAVELYRKAAEQGHDSAQCRLGFAYMDGKGVEKDYALAEQWFRKSAKNGNPVAEDFLETIFEKEGGLKWRKSPSVKELTETERKCLEILRFFRERRYLEAFKILDGFEPEVANGDNKNSVGTSDPTEAIHVGVDEEWNQHYVKTIMLEREHKLAQALKEARTSARIALERLGPEHVDFAASLNMLAELYGSLDRKELSFAFLRRSLVIRFRNLGLWHSEVAECLHNIACLDSKSRSVEATVSRLSCNALALRIRVRVFGKRHPAVALSLVRLGRAYRARYDFKPALKCVRKAISIYDETIGPDHCMTQIAKRALESIKRMEECMNSLPKEV